MNLPLANVLMDFLGFLLLYSGLSKLRAPRRFADQVSAFGLLPSGPSRAVAYAILPIEAATGLAISLRYPLLPGLIAATILLAIFAAFVAWAIASKRRLACFCFGESDGGFVSKSTLLRNATLLGLAAFALALAVAVPIPPARGLDRLLSAVYALSALLIFLSGFGLASLRIGERRMVT